MTRRADIVAAAREYLGTPFVHQGRVKGVGVDCIGLAYCAASDCGVELQDQHGYARQPLNERMRERMREQLDVIPFAEAQPGDIALFKIHRDPQHIGVFGDYPGGGLSIIHAYVTLGLAVESALTEVWIKRIVECYRFRGVSA